jgi:hypothetical protein
VGLVEDQELERRAREDAHVLAAGEQQLELLDVGQQDAGLAAVGPHRLAAGALLGRQQRDRLPASRICFSRSM